MHQLWQAQESDSSALWDVVKAGEARGRASICLAGTTVLAFGYPYGNWERG